MAASMLAAVSGASDPVWRSLVLDGQWSWVCDIASMQPDSSQNGSTRSAIALFAVCSLVGIVTPSPARSGPIEGDIAAGKAFAERNCARCHAIGRQGASPVKDAVPLRTISRRYPLDTLYEAFAEGIVVGHTDMPEFALDPKVITDLLAYIQSISDK